MGFIQNLGPLQLVLIVVVILVLFGVGKLPQVGKGVGPVSYTHLTLPTKA